MDKQYFDPDPPPILIDRETGEKFIINPAGTKIYVEAEDE